MKVDFLKNHPEHLNTVCDWLHTEWAYLHPSRTRQELMHVLQQRLSAEHLPMILIALENASVVGTATLRANELISEPQLHSWLSSVYVTQAFRGHGYGSQLVLSAVAVAKKLDIKQLYLYTDKWDLVNWYERLGWKMLKKSGYKGDDIYIMSNELEFYHG